MLCNQHALFETSITKRSPVLGQDFRTFGLLSVRFTQKLLNLEEVQEIFFFLGPNFDPPTRHRNQNFQKHCIPILNLWPTNAYEEADNSHWCLCARTSSRNGWHDISACYDFDLVLYHSNQFGRGCDLWQACRNFSFGNLPNLPWHVQIFGKFSAVLRRRRRKISILGTWSLNEFRTLQKLPWPPWHFSVLEGLVTRDCRIDLNGTVWVSNLRFLGLWNCFRFISLMINGQAAIASKRKLVLELLPAVTLIIGLCHDYIIMVLSPTFLSYLSHLFAYELPRSNRIYLCITAFFASVLSTCQHLSVPTPLFLQRQGNRILRNKITVEPQWMNKH